MKKFLILTLALVLSGCTALAPVSPTSAPPPTAQVIIATVLVPVMATQAPTNVPTETPIPPSPTPQVIVVTATPGNTQAAPAATSGPANSGGATATATLPSDAYGLTKGGQVLFTNLTRSGSYFNLRCPPQDITFGVSTSNIAVVEVDIWYRMEDLTTQPTTISDWHNLGKMTGDKNGNYTIDINTLQQLGPDLRASAKAWFDYQFVGIAKDGNPVGNSGKISQQVLYLKDCP